MPVTENGNYSIPVMARRDLHGDYRSPSSTSFSSTMFSSPTRFISNVRSHLANGYSAIRDRISHLAHHEQETTSTLLNSPTTQRIRATRSSSQSSTNGQASGYNLRRRAPVHSTPRDNDSEQIEQRKVKRKDRKSQDDKEQEEETTEDKEKESEKPEEQQEENQLITYAKDLLYLPIRLFQYVWNILFSLPLWLLIPILLLLGLYFRKFIRRAFIKSLSYF